MELCLNCNREFEAKHKKVFNELKGRWVEKTEDLCPECKEDLEMEDENYEEENEDSDLPL